MHVNNTLLVEKSDRVHQLMNNDALLHAAVAETHRLFAA